MSLLIELNEATAARRRVPVSLVDDTDGKTGETAITISAGDLKMSKNGAAEANHGGTLTELAAGDYYYELSAGEVDTLGYLTGRVTKAGVRVYRFAVQVVAFDPYAVLSTLTAAQVNTEADAAITDAGLVAGLAAIQADTDNVQTRLPAALVGGRIDASVGAMAADVLTAAAAAADLTTELQAGLATAASISALNNLAAADVWAAGTRVLTAGTNIVLVKGTGITGFNDLSAAQVNTEADTALVDVGLTTVVTGRVDAAISTRATPADVQTELGTGLDAIIPDSIPADGTRPSVKQALYMLTQFMLERNVSGTTCTVRKPDGSTALFTLTLNDAVTPTAITRAT